MDSSFKLFWKAELGPAFTKKYVQCFFLLFSWHDRGFAGGCTIGAWAFIPAFLTVELSTCMADPADFNKSLLLAGTLNVITLL